MELKMTEAQLRIIFGKNLKTLRQLSGLTQKQLAAKINYHETFVSLLELGYRTPNMGTVITLIDFFQVPLEVFIGRQPIPTDEILKRFKEK